MTTLTFADLVDRMLAAMTMNVGYFISFLGGFFLGESVVGRFVVLVVEAH